MGRKRHITLMLALPAFVVEETEDLLAEAIVELFGIPCIVEVRLNGVEFRLLGVFNDFLRDKPCGLVGIALGC